MDLSGMVDLHVHSAPDVYERSVDDTTLVQEAAAEGMKAVLLKSHHTLTADRATLAADRANASVSVFGGVALNLPVGGLNPVAVETALAFGAKQIWMPTLHARHCLAHAEQPMFRDEAAKGRAGISVLDEAGQLVAPIDAILEMIRDADVILGTGHLAPQESLTLLRHARDRGLKKLLVTHPLMSFTRFTLDEMQTAVENGALLELDYLSCSPNWHGAVSPSATAEAIRHVGFRHCVLGTDGGQPYNPHPAVMLRDFAAALAQQGIAAEDVRVMTVDNPSRLLGL